MSGRNSRSASRGSRTTRSNAGVMDMARERPVAAVAIAAGAAAAGLFLWSKRSQISNQLSNLSDQIGEWAGNMGSDIGIADDTAGLAISDVVGNRKNGGRTPTRRRPQLSSTAGDDATPGTDAGNIGVSSTGSAEKDRT